MEGVEDREHHPTYRLLLPTRQAMCYAGVWTGPHGPFLVFQQKLDTWDFMWNLANLKTPPELNKAWL